MAPVSAFGLSLRTAIAFACVGCAAWTGTGCRLGIAADPRPSRRGDRQGRADLSREHDAGLPPGRRAGLRARAGREADRRRRPGRLPRRQPRPGHALHRPARRPDPGPAAAAASSTCSAPRTTSASWRAATAGGRRSRRSPRSCACCAGPAPRRTSRSRTSPRIADFDATPQFATTVADAIGRSGVPSDQLIIQSFWPPNLTVAQQRLPGVEISFLSIGAANAAGIDLAHDNGYSGSRRSGRSPRTTSPRRTPGPAGGSLHGR